MINAHPFKIVKFVDAKFTRRRAFAHRRWELVTPVQTGSYEEGAMDVRNADSCVGCTESFVEAVTGEGAHAAGRGAGVGSERPEAREKGRTSRQRWMMDGVDTGGSSPALSKQHKPDLPG